MSRRFTLLVLTSQPARQAEAAGGNAEVARARRRGTDTPPPFYFLLSTRVRARCAPDAREARARERSHQHASLFVVAAVLPFFLFLLRSTPRLPPSLSRVRVHVVNEKKK